MGIKFFGHHLLDEGKLTKEQLNEAVEYQNAKNLSLGEIAVREKMLQASEADKINEKQRVLDKRFGEVAVSLGYLNEQQIEELLAIQKAEKVFFGEVLITKGFMTQDELDSELSAFEKMQKLEVVKLDSLVESVDKEGVIKQSMSVLQTLYSRIAHDYIKLVHVELHNFQLNDNLLILQSMRGDIHLDFALQLDESVLLHLSEQFLKMPFSEVDEMVEDIAHEFVNIVLGNIAVKLSEQGGFKTELTPPQKSETLEGDFYAFTFTTTSGSAVLYLAL